MTPEGQRALADEPDFFERTLVGWHVLFGAMVAIAALGLVASGHPWGLALLAVLTAAYVTLAVPVMHDRAPVRRAYAYIAVAYVVFAVLAWTDPTTLVLLFALYPQTFAALPTLPAVAGTVVLTTVLTLSLLARDGWSMESLADNGISGLMSLAMALVVGLFITGLVRQSESRRQLLRELHETQGQLAAAERDRGALAERERLAREIHDTLAQGFTSIVMLSQTAEAALDAADAADARNRVRQIQATARENLADARTLVAALSPAGLREAGLAESLRRLAERFTAESGVAVSLEVVGTAAGAVAGAGDVVLLRAAQEALANVRKHAGAGTVTMTLAYDEDGALLTVADDGQGFDPDGGDPGGFGLAGMRARVEEAGGLVDLRTAPGRGTTLRVRVP